MTCSAYKRDRKELAMDSLMFEFSMIHNFCSTDGQASSFLKSKLVTGNSQHSGESEHL